MIGATGLLLRLRCGPGARSEGRDLLLIDTGDLHDGNGLADGFPPYNKDEPGGKEAVDGHVSNQIFAMVDYDLLTIGNHELYNYTVAKDVYQNFVPQWGGRYMTSNVKIALPGPDAPNASYAPIGSLFNTLVTPVQGFKIMSYGILFDFKLAAKGIAVQPPQEMVEEDWFNHSLDRAEKWGVDAFVVLGHMPYQAMRGGKLFAQRSVRAFPTHRLPSLADTPMFEIADDGQSVRWRSKAVDTWKRLGSWASKTCRSANGTAIVASQVHPSLH